MGWTRLDTFNHVIRRKFHFETHFPRVFFFSILDVSSSPVRFWSFRFFLLFNSMVSFKLTIGFFSFRYSYGKCWSFSVRLPAFSSGVKTANAIGKNVKIFSSSTIEKNRFFSKIFPTTWQRLSFVDHLFVSSSSYFYIRIIIVWKISQSARIKNTLDILFYSDVSLYNFSVCLVSLVIKSPTKFSRSFQRQVFRFHDELFLRLGSNIHRSKRIFLFVFSTSFGRIHFVAFRRKLNKRFQNSDRKFSSEDLRVFLREIELCRYDENDWHNSIVFLNFHSSSYEIRDLSCHLNSREFTCVNFK